jgi:PST family polysaccharide transporter
MNLKSKLLSETMYYALIQASNFAIPLITLPYITRVVGVEKFGLLEMALVFSNFFVLFVKFGFEYTATREIAISDKKDLSFIFSKYFYAKVCIFISSCLLFFVSVLFSETVLEHFWIFFFTFLGVFGDFLLPAWLYRGMGNVRFVALNSFFVKLLFLPLVFIFIQEEDDFFYRPLLMSLLNVSVSFFMLFYAFKLYKLCFEVIRFSVVINSILKATPIFVSSALTLFSGAFSLVFLGMVFGVDSKTLGGVASAQKVIQIINNIVVFSISQVFYPYFAKVFKSNFEQYRKIFIRTSMLFIGLGSFIGLSLYSLSGFVFKLVFGSAFVSYSGMLDIICFVPMLTLLVNLLLIQGLSGMDKDKLVLYINFFVFVISMPTLYLSYMFYDVEGVLMQRNLVLLLTICLGVYFVRKNFKDNLNGSNAS